MSSLPPPGECWAITDYAAGNQRQALALAERLGMPVRHLVLAPRAPWSWLAPRMTLGGRLTLPRSQRAIFTPPWPRVAIGCGRGAALFTRMLRELAEGHCHTVQVLDPRIDPAHWDTVIAPRHDQLIGPNVLQPLGSLNPIDDEWLQDGREASPTLIELPRPRVGVLIGGPRTGIRMDADYTQQLLKRLLDSHRRDGGSIMALASRRTPVDRYHTPRTTRHPRFRLVRPGRRQQPISRRDGLGGSTGGDAGFRQYAQRSLRRGLSSANTGDRIIASQTAAVSSKPA
jgi:mitochondrial fission protein ELM1